MEAPLEIRYAGVVIGRAQEVRSAEGDDPSFFIPVRDPMPVGTVLRMRSGDHETPVRVVRAVETTDATACGMRVRTIGEAEEVAPEFIPPPAVVAEKIKPETPTPVVEVDLASMAEATAPEVAVPADTSASATIPAVDPVATPAIEIVEATPAAENTTPAVKAAVTTPAVEAAVTTPAVETAGATPAVEAAVTTPAVETAGAAPAETVSGSSGAAVPEAVPAAIGSSMTGALQSATESAAVGEPAPVASARPSAKATSPSPDLVEISQPENGAVADAAPEAGRLTAEYGGQATELPPARPIAGPSGRRKTKRRR
jgi:hypothetical protein